MIEAPKTAELSSQPTKRRWKAWLIGLACVVAAATIALLATPPEPEPVKVWSVRGTNELGVKKLILEGTNGLLNPIQFSAAVFTGGIRKGIGPTGVGPRYSLTGAEVPAGKPFHFTLDAPPKIFPYYVVWDSWDTGRISTPWFTFRMACSAFFQAHGMRVLARASCPKPAMGYIPATEIKE